jgi:hypothetical protein
VWPRVAESCEGIWITKGHHPALLLHEKKCVGGAVSGRVYVCLEIYVVGRGIFKVYHSISALGVPWGD